MQTRSKYRLLQNNSAVGAAAKEPTQPSAQKEKNVKRKRKRNNDNNSDNAQAIPDSITTTFSSLTPSTIDPVLIEPIVVASASTPPHGQWNCTTDNPFNDQPSQALSSPLHNLSTVFSLEAVDAVLEGHDDDDRHLHTSYLINNSNDFDEETFDNNLHLHQQTLIDALNREENEQELLQIYDTNSAAVELQTPDSWVIEQNDLQWTKTRKGKDCLIIGNFSYIYMSKSEKKNVLNFRCQRRDVRCGAVVHLDLNTRTLIDTNNVNHNHPPDGIGMKQKILNQKIDDKLASEPTSVLKVIERVYADANLTDEEQLNIRLPRTAGEF